MFNNDTLDIILKKIYEKDGDKMIGDMTIIEFLVQSDGMWMENAYGNCTWGYGKTFEQQSKKVQDFITNHLL